MLRPLVTRLVTEQQFQDGCFPGEQLSDVAARVLVGLCNL